MNSDIKQHLLTAPTTEVDLSLRYMIQKWSEPPKSLEILEVLDAAVFSSSASGFVVRLLELMLEHAIASENVTYEEVVKQATWRKNEST